MPHNPIAKKYALIVAGGSGMRFGSQLPKQYVDLAGRPVLMHTIDVFRKSAENIEIVLVLPDKDIPLWKELCEKHHFNSPERIASSGATRFHSVLNGLNMIDGNEGLVAIHDGVRPLVTSKMIDDSFNLAGKEGTAVPAINMVDSVRRVDEAGNSCSLERSALRAVQTPQTFNLNLIKSAYQNGFLPEFTDDASVAEKYGHKIYLYKGNVRNIKITHPVDIVTVEFYMSCDE